MAKTETETPEAAPNQALQPARVPVPARLGMAPTTLEEGWRLAQMMAKSELVPKSFRNRPEDVLVAIQLGVEIGLAPMAALQSIAVINGRPSLWGDGMLGVIMAAPDYRDHDEYYEVDGVRRDTITVDDLKKDTTTAVCTFSRMGKATPVTRRFSVGQAKKAGLYGKDGPWQTHPDRMLLLRARGFAARDTFPDVLRGVRTAEEAQDLPPEPTATQLSLPVPEVRRKSETPATPAPTTATATDASIIVGPVRVLDVQNFQGGYTVTCDGITVDTTEPQDALDLEAFKGTAHTVRLVCHRVGETFQLDSFTAGD